MLINHCESSLATKQSKQTNKKTKQNQLDRRPSASLPLSFPPSFPPSFHSFKKVVALFHNESYSCIILETRSPSCLCDTTGHLWLNGNKTKHVIEVIIFNERSILPWWKTSTTSMYNMEFQTYIIPRSFYIYLTLSISTY